MNLQKLSDKQLLSETEKVVRIEKSQTIIVLRHLQEIERRKLFGDLACGSLFDYCIDNLGYSRAEAQLRISAMRLMKDSIEVEKALEVGQLSLTNASMAYSHLRENEKETGVKPSLDKKLNLIHELKDQPTRKAEAILDSKKGGNKKPKSKEKVSLGARTRKALDEIKKLMGEDLNEEEIIALALDEKLISLKKKPQNRKILAKTDTRYISEGIKLQVRQRANHQCEFKAGEKRCRERRNLQYDHIYPFAWGGKSELGNIQLLCANHNRRRAIKSFGMNKMNYFGRSK